MGIWHRAAFLGRQAFVWAFAAVYCTIWTVAAYFGLGELVDEFRHFRALIAIDASSSQILLSVMSIFGLVLGVAILVALAIALAHSAIRYPETKPKDKNT